MKSEPASYTIEPDAQGNGVWVVRHDEYPETSVLAGQYRRSLVGNYDDAQAALFEYPNAKVLDYSTKGIIDVSVPSVPPSWFDPMDAGERWDEDY